jgi:hypothetical protein
MSPITNTRTRVFAALTFSIAMPMVFAVAQSRQAQRSTDFCSQTARALFESCKAEVTDNRFKQKAICLNISDPDKRQECLDDLEAARKDSNDQCQEQLEGRLAACRSLGEDRYDPTIDPATFDHDFNHSTNPNPYFPLTPGNKWEYRGGDEVNTVEASTRTKLIEGVTCIVFDDLVFKNGDLTEQTADYFAMNKDGNVHYFGEETKEFQSFDGDNPRTPELISIDGLFKHGREGDKGGIIFLASPRVGNVYREEFSLGNAEDVAEILSTTYSFGSNTELDRFVPRQLAERFCSRGDCVVTKNFSLLEPGVIERKYYARGVGFFLEVDPDTKEVLRLVNCNFDSRCANLPRP